MSNQRLSNQDKKELEIILKFTKHNIPLPEYEKVCDWSGRCNLDCAFCVHANRRL